MDSMTKDELDCVKPITESRLLRISKGAGTQPKELLFLLGEHKRFSKTVERMGKMNLDGLDSEEMKRNPQKMMQNLQKAIDPNMLKQMGGGGGAPNMNMMQQMMEQMGGGGGGG